MIKILTSSIIEFLQAESQIKTNELYPILEFCKIEALEGGECKITRTSMNAWVAFKTKCVAETPVTYLVDDRILRGFTAQLNEASEVSIYAKDQQLYLKSGKQQLCHQLMDAATFPPFPDKTITGATVEMPSEVIKSIKTAMAYTKQLQYNTAFSFVALSESGDIFGSNGNYVYLKNFDFPLPNILIGAEAAAILDSEKSYRFMDNESYYFLISETTIYGFVKTEMNRVNYAPLVTQGDRGVFFTIKTADIVRFCNLCLAAAKELTPRGILSQGLLYYADASFNIDVKAQIEVGGNTAIEDFKFNTQDFKKMISVLPFKTINFSPVGPNLIAYTEEDKGYVGVFSGTA